MVTEKEDKQEIDHLFEIIKKNPQLRSILSNVDESAEEMKMDDNSKDALNKSLTKSNLSGVMKIGASVQRIETRLIDGSNLQHKNNSFLSKKDSLALKMTARLNEIKQMSKFNDSIENEFAELIRSIIDIKQKSFNGFLGVCTFEPTDVITAIVDLTDLDGIQLTLDQIPTAIRVLRKIIEIENDLTIKPAAEWSGEEDNPTPEIIRNQNLLASCEACYLAANLVRNQKGDAITNEAFLLGIALLIGGNKTVQMKFWEDMVSDVSNRFLKILSELLKTNFMKVMDHATAYNELSKRIHSMEKNKLSELKDSEENNMEEYNELIALRERLDARTQADEEDEEDFTSISYSMKICIRILRFIQLLCENHNIKLQDHLREQVNREGVTLGVNIDIPTTISNMLGIFAKEANIDIMDLGGQIIDTLIELIQGPCEGNQKALISAKIIDYCRDFIAEYQEEGMEDEMKIRGFDLTSDEHVDMISETKQKLVVLLLSLLEGTPDNSIISRMIQSLDFDMLKIRMFSIYKNFVTDLLKLKQPKDDTIANTPISTVNDHLTKDSFEGLIQEGFDIYILFQSLAVHSKLARSHLEDSEFTVHQKAAYDFFKEH